MKKLFFILILSVTVLFSKTNHQKNITLQLSWLNQFQFAGYYIAKEKGFYKEHGINVEIKEFTKDTDILNSVLNNEAQFSIGRSSLLIDKALGKDIVALGAIFQSSPLMILTTNPDIKDISDFKNKKIMITSDAENVASISAMLKSNNIMEKDLIFMNHSFDINDLINKKTDLMASYVSNEPLLLDEKNISYKIFHPRDFGFNFYSDILFTSKKFLNKHPKLVKNFYDASIKGWEYAFEHKAETAEIIFNKYNTQNKTYIELLKEAEILEKFIFNDKDKEIGSLDKDRLENIVDTFKTLGFIKNTPDLKSFMYEENHNRKLTFRLHHFTFKIIIISAIFAFILLSIIAYFANRLNKERKMLNMVLTSSEDLIFYKDKSLKYIGCNKAFEKLLNLNESDIIGKTDFELFDENYAEKLKKNDLKVLSQGETTVNNTFLESNNKKYYYQFKKVPLKDKNKIIGILGICRDITEIHKFQEKLEEIAITDELTQTLNRKAFNERIDQQFNLYSRYKNPFCIAMIDIDNFKNINDTYGHDVGDIVLKKLCEVIKSNIRNTDTLFRLGGEEFLVLYPEVNIESAHNSLSKLHNIINNEIMEQKNNIKLTVSIGLSQVKENDTINSIYKRADDNLYYAKQHGKDQIIKDKD